MADPTQEQFTKELHDILAKYQGETDLAAEVKRLQSQLDQAVSLIKLAEDRQAVNLERAFKAEGLLDGERSARAVVEATLASLTQGLSTTQSFTPAPTIAAPMPSFEMNGRYSKTGKLLGMTVMPKAN